MDNTAPAASVKENQPLTALERKIVELIDLCDQLDRENRQLKSAALDWQREREELVRKNEMARGRIEAMIARLRTLEQES